MRGEKLVIYIYIALRESVKLKNIKKQQRTEDNEKVIKYSRNGRKKYFLIIFVSALITTPLNPCCEKPGGIGSVEVRRRKKRSNTRYMTHGNEEEEVASSRREKHGPTCATLPNISPTSPHLEVSLERKTTCKLIRGDVFGAFGLVTWNIDISDVFVVVLTKLKTPGVFNTTRLLLPSHRVAVADSSRRSRNSMKAPATEAVSGTSNRCHISVKSPTALQRLLKPSTRYHRLGRL